MRSLIHGSRRQQCRWPRQSIHGAKLVSARDSNAIGVAAARHFKAVNAAAWDVARAPCQTVNEFVAKLRFARNDCAERGVVDAVVLALLLLDGLAEDAIRLGRYVESPS